MGQSPRLLSDVPLPGSASGDPVPPAAVPRLKFRMFRTVSALMFREMSTSYGRTPGGYIWAVLEPVAYIVMLAVGFSLILRSPSLGTSFLLFYASAILPLRVFQIISGALGGAISFNKPLMSYPRVTFVDVLVARLVLQTVTQVMVNTIVIVGVFYWDNIREIIDPVPILEAYAATLWLAIGIGTLNCYLSFSFPLWRQVWGIATRPLLLVSGIFYIYEDLPHAAQQVLWYNPLIHITGLSRTGYYSTYSPEYIDLTYVFSIGAVSLLFGVAMLYGHGKSMMHK